jgi:hypothetical protein
VSSATVRFVDGPYDGKRVSYGPCLPPALYFQRCESGRWRTYTYLLVPSFRIAGAAVYQWEPD